MRHSVEEVRLANGTRGLLINIPDAPVMSFDFGFRAGYFTADQTKLDIPHVLEHVLLGANKKYKKARYFNAELEKNGAYSNGTTNTTMVHYMAECADFEWDRILDLLLTAITSPLLLPSEFKSEMGNVREELMGNLNSYFRVLGGQLAKDMGLPVVTDRERIGQLDSITHADIKKHYGSTHTTANLRFVIAGRIYGRKGKIVSKLRNMLKPMERGTLIDWQGDAIKSRDSTLVIQKPDVEQIHFYTDTYVNTRISDTEYDALSVLNAVLTGTLHSMILGEAREKGLIYGMGSGGSRGVNWSSWWFGGNVSPENLEPLVRLIKRKLTLVLDGKIAKKDVDAAIQLSLGRFLRENQRVSDIVRRYSSQYFYDETIEDYAKIPDYISAVNKSEITKIARKMIKGDTWGIGLLGNVNPEHAKSAYAEIGKLYV